MGVDHPVVSRQARGSSVIAEVVVGDRHVAVLVDREGRQEGLAVAGGDVKSGVWFTWIGAVTR